MNKNNQKLQRNAQRHCAALVQWGNSPFIITTPPLVYNLITGVVSGIFLQSLSPSLHDVDCSVLFFLVFTKCCLSWLSIIFTSSVLILTIYFLVYNSFPSCCHSPNLEENLWLLDHQLLPNPLWIFHISSCAYGWGCDVADCICSHFLSLGLLMCSLFSEAKDWLYRVSLNTHLVELS